MPGFDGGMDQTFEVRVNQKGGKQYSYVKVVPEAATTFTVTNLNPDTEYEFTVRGENTEGEGPYYLGIVSTRTESKSYYSGTIAFWGTIFAGP